MKKLYLFCFLLLSSLFFSQSTTSFHDTQGNIEVNGGGQLQYSLPISLPAGIKNVAPNINLIYTSGGGNGIAGYGWNISGVTAISRVGKTIDKDGVLEGVKLDYSDNYSFNGQKLILKSGVYGQDGAEYVTEKYSNIKIKSVGTASVDNLPPTWNSIGPEHFEVTFEDGSQAWYGSYIFRSATNATTPIEYNITKWKDAQGNVINYNYEQTNNVAVIKSIQWGGNENLNKPNFNEVTFNYTTRELNEISYVNGAPFIQNKILNEIIVKSNGLPFKKYAFDNTFKNGTNYNFINKITEYNSNNEAANPVTFEYPTPVLSSVEPIQYGNPDPFNGVKLTGDFNGDSYLDFVMSNGTIKLGALNDNFTTITTNKYFNSDALVVNNLIDEEGQIYNGNGIVQYEAGKVVGYIFRDNNFVKVFEKLVYDQSDCVPNGSLGCRVSSKINEGDIDGDGVSDVFLSLSKTVNECIYTNPVNTGRPPADCTIVTNTYNIGDFIIDLKNQNSPVSTYTTNLGSYSGPFLDSDNKYIDVDADGKVDVLNMTNSKYTVFEFVKTGPNQYSKNVRFSKNLVETKDAEFPILYGDFNGDGKLDFTIPTANSSSSWRFYIGTGKGFNDFLQTNFTFYKNRVTETTNGYNKNTYQYFYSVADMNKDGKSDIVTVYSYNSLNLGNLDWRYYGYHISTKIFTGASSDGKLGFIDGVTYQSPNTNLHDNTDTTLFTPLTNPIKANNNYYNVFLYWKEKLVKIKAPSSLSELARIKSISQANVTTTIDYLELNPDINPTFYKKEKKEYYPYFSLIRADQTYAVSRLNQLFRKQDFRYRGMTAHLQGKGMLGFLQSARSSWYVDGKENTIIWSGSEMDPQKGGVPSKQWSIKTNNETQIFPTDLSVNNAQLLSFKQTQYSQQFLANGVEVLLPQSVTEKDFLKNVKSESTITYGDYYLPTFTEINVENGFARKTTEMHYTHNPNGIGKDYYIGRPDWKEDISYAYNDSKKSKESYTYNNNLLETLTKYDQNNVGWIKEEYTYDEGVANSFGNITQKKITNSKQDRIITTKAHYETQGRFVDKTTDNLGLVTNVTYNNWGQVLTQKDIFNNTVTNTYDNWQKIISSTSNLTGTTSYSYQKFDLSNPAIGSYGMSGTAITENLPNGNFSTVLTNYLGQQYKTITKDFQQGTYLVKEVSYDPLGRKIAESEPYKSSSISYAATTPSASNWNIISYDDSVFPAKVTVQSFNNGKKAETSINGRTTTIVEKNGYLRTYTKTTDATGNLISSTDPGGTINYSYNAAGQQIKAQYAENEVTTSYDEWGRKSEFNDPANGKYEYTYTGFGDLKTETSRKGYKQYFYKPNGLVDQIIEKSNEASAPYVTDKNYSFSYDPTSQQLILKSGTANSKSFSTAYAYRPDGRIGWTTEYMGGKQFFKQNITYDSFGRIKRYDQGIVSSGVTTSVAIENNYAPWDGTLYQLKQENSGKVLWELQGTNAKGQVTSAKLGAVQITNTYDGFGFLDREKHTTSSTNLMEVKYTFDALKNELKERHHYNFGIDEYFDYDANNRLINWTDPVTRIKPVNDRNGYDVKGRITFNDQIGTIGFNMGGNIYRPSEMKLNASGLINYDIDGTNTLLQEVTYNENNDPVKISGTDNDYAFEYGLTENRQTMNYGGKFDDSQDATFTKYYSESGDAEVIYDHATGKEKHLLYIGGTPYESSIVLMKDFAETTPKLIYLHKDYLGSILAVSDELGNAVERRHFDAWGIFTHLQKGNGAAITDKNAINNSSLVIDRGYTSHEYLAGVGLIHMNGRLYDPLLRRFLNADENIQDPTNTQNYNKYGYVMNNPLMFSDPSGEFWEAGWLLIAVGNAIAGTLVGVAVAAGIYLVKSLVTGSWSWNGFARSLLVGAITGGLGGGFLGIYSATGFNGAVVLGSMYGAIGGGVDAIFSGQNFFKGLYSGAIAGAAFAGISYTINYFVNGGSTKFFENDNVSNESAGKMPADPEQYLHDVRYKELNYNYRDVLNYGLEGDYLDKTSLYSANGYGYNSFTKNYSIVGYSQRNFWTGKTSIYYSKFAITHHDLLIKNMSHETAHAYGSNFALINARKSFKNITDDRLNNIEHLVIKDLEWTTVNINHLSTANYMNLINRNVLSNMISSLSKSDHLIFQWIRNLYEPIFNKMILK